MIIKAAWVCPISSAPIRDGFVEVDGVRIVRAGRAGDLPVGAKDIADLGSAVLLPGLVNAHTHLELTCYAGALPPGPFWEWISKLVVLRAAPGQNQREDESVADGARLSLAAGVTCVGDISRRGTGWRAIKQVPIRKVCFVELLALAQEPPRNLDELRAGVAAVEEDELLTVGVTPHAPYSVPAEQIRSAIELAVELDRPWTMHLAETQQEVAFLAGERGSLGTMIESLMDQCGVRTPEQRPGAFLRTLDGGHGGAIAHGNYFEPDGFADLAAADHTVVYCPRAHHFFGHAPHPWLAMREAGVRVAIGTDSPASNYSVSLLDELHHLRTHVPGAPPADELLTMVTLDAARALRLDTRIGSLEAGKQADLAAFAGDKDIDDPLEYIVQHPQLAQAVWVAGRQVV